MFSLISVLRKNDISIKCGKSRKYDIYVERFYENIVGTFEKEKWFFVQCLLYIYIKRNCFIYLRKILKF